MVNEIVLIGRSNVGKSTLFKALTGRNVRIGRRPGVTLSPTRVRLGDLVYVDMPGYGFMERIPVSRQEKTKDFIVHYFEDHRQDLLLVIQVIDASSFLDIARRWERRGEVPLEVELFEFLMDLDTTVAVAANKMDKVSRKDETLDGIGERLGMLPPWRQWPDRIAPISAKKGEIGPLLKIIRDMHNRKK
jgi:GTP-binding protein EngB required for normal cell division